MVMMLVTQGNEFTWDLSILKIKVTITVYVNIVTCENHADE